MDQDIKSAKAMTNIGITMDGWMEINVPFDRDVSTSTD